jgi:hypothetical protein
MKKNKKILVFVLLLLFYSININAQHKFELSAEFRPRMEQRHGYRNLAPLDSKSAFFVSERLRLNTFYAYKFMKMYVSLQDYRVWGNEEQVKNFGSFGLHEAWVEFNVKDKVEFKLGRQEISYDDNRLLGNLDWAQQARKHDGLVIKVNHNNSKLHVGASFNQSAEQTIGTVYQLKNYKVLTYAWYNQKLDSGRTNLSVYAVADGISTDTAVTHKSPVVYFRFTFGPYVSFKYKHFNGNLGAYLQTGKTINNQKILAFFTYLYGEYTSPKINVGLGYDYLSGKNESKSNNNYNAFNTLYPTNHKFYGHMDYFLDIPADTKNGGLQDLYARLQYKPKPKGMLGFDAHYFLLANKKLDAINIGQFLKEPLGFEFDLYGSYMPIDFMTINAGYSFMIATKSMEAIKAGANGSRKAYNGWSFIMITIKPSLFKYEKDVDAK